MSSEGNAVVRRARAEDDVEIGELLVDAFVTAYADKMPEVVVTEQRKADLRAVAAKREQAIVLVIEMPFGDGAVTKNIGGTVSLWAPGAAGSEAWIAGAADLRHLATHSSLHGKRLSKMLLDEIERIAFEECNASAICLHVRRGNHGVRRLYESRGYVRDESGDREEPTVSLMAFCKRR